MPFTHSYLAHFSFSVFLSFCVCLNRQSVCSFPSVHPSLSIALVIYPSTHLPLFIFHPSMQSSIYACFFLNN